MFGLSMVLGGLWVVNLRSFIELNDLYIYSYSRRTHSCVLRDMAILGYLGQLQPPDAELVFPLPSLIPYQVILFCFIYSFRLFIPHIHSLKVISWQHTV